jgi:hypothetical protein
LPQAWRCSQPARAASRYKRTTFDPMETDGLRLEVQLTEKFSSGLLQWKVE